ncbi:MAG: deoxyribodipyrimidine photolyase [Bacteroidetes bacterium]|nr:deoxyribodipyrimidine photolyase [Bacteroidota bacterium]
MMPQLLTRYADILAAVDRVDATAYARTRNYTDGAVSYLSPYISRGVISLPYVRERILSRYSRQQAYTFIFELAWREYFQRQWYQLGDQLWSDIKGPQMGVAHHGVPDALINGATGITAIDTAIEQLYTTGYMHNHVRMYVASIACNIGHAHWSQPARWLYYHLADHDLASNTMSWQWVVGTFSAKKYYCDQGNINKYCHTQQRGTFLDVPYERLPDLAIPEILKAHSVPGLHTILPDTPAPQFYYDKPLLIYNACHLDPLWRADMDANRVLLLEPEHYRKYPVSPHVLSFILRLAENIPGIQLFCGSIEDLIRTGNFPQVYTRQHPTTLHYLGIKDEPDWLFPQVDKVPGSFMSYWKKCEKYL